MNATITNPDNGTLIYQLQCDVVAATLPELRSELRRLVDEGARDFVIDMANTRMVDSSGLGLLIALHNSLKKHNGRLSLTHVSKDLMKLFESMRIHQFLTVSPA